MESVLVWPNVLFACLLFYVRLFRKVSAVLGSGKMSCCCGSAEAIWEQRSVASKVFEENMHEQPRQILDKTLQIWDYSKQWENARDSNHGLQQSEEPLSHKNNKAVSTPPPPTPNPYLVWHSVEDASSNYLSTWTAPTKQNGLQLVFTLFSWSRRVFLFWYWLSDFQIRRRVLANTHCGQECLPRESSSV